MAASMSLGASRSEAFVRVFLPQTAAGVLAAAVLVFTYSMGFFVTPALIGAGRQVTISGMIYTRLVSLVDWGAASSLAMIVVAAIVVVYLITGRLVGFQHVFGLGVGVPHRTNRQRWSGGLVSSAAKLARHIPRQERKWGISKATLLLAVLLLNVPLVWVMAMSFQPKPVLAFPTDGGSLKWYRSALLGGSEWPEAILNSLRIGLVATAVAVVVGFLLATQIRRVGAAVGTGLILLALAPLAIPTIFLAVGVYSVFLQLGLVGNTWAVACAQAMAVFPFAFLSILNGLQRYDLKFDAAAESLGARPAKRLMRVKVPLLAPAFLSAAALAFVFAFDELIVTLFVSGVGFYTLPIRMFAGANQNISPELAAVGSLVVVGAVVSAALLGIILRRVRHDNPRSTADLVPTAGALSGSSASADLEVGVG